MNYINQILFFFGAIGVFNSFIIAVYLLINKSYSNLNNRLFGLFLLLLSLRVIKSLFYSFSTEDPIWFLQSGPSFFLLIGPLLFCYTLSIINPNSFWIRHWKAHILFWLFIVAFLLFFIPFKYYNELNKTIILPIINLQWLIFILLSGIIIKLNNENSIQIKWLLILTIAVFIIWTSYAFTSFDYFVSGSIIFSVLFYSLFMFFLFNKKVSDKIFTKAKIKKIPHVSIESQSLVQKLKEIVKSEKPYTNPNLKIADVAVKLQISTHELSKLINENLGKSFTEFVNEYRIEEAKQLIATNTNYTIEAIGNLSGFNSKSAFYKAFKKHTNTTPAKYQTNL